MMAPLNVTFLGDKAKKTPHFFHTLLNLCKFAFYNMDVVIADATRRVPTFGTYFLTITNYFLLMKQFKLLVASLAMIFSSGAMAQTDVTITYLTNADFSQGTPVTVGVCTYEKDKGTNGTEYARLVPVDGWDAVNSVDGKAGGLFAIGGGAWLGGKGYTAPPTDSDGNTGVNVLGVVTCWSATVQYTQELKTPLLAGTYTLVLAAYNSGGGQNDISANLIGFVEDGGTTHYATTKKYNSNTWKYEFITFTLSAETSGKISIGYVSPNTGSGNMPHLFVSGLQLFEGEVDAEAYEAAKIAAREIKEAKVLWQNALTAAQQALDNSDYAGAERTALETEVGKTEPTTKDGYNEATSALTAATTAFLAAAEAYNANKDALEDEIFYAGVIGVATADAEAVLTNATSTAADFQAAAEALKVTEYDTFAGEGTEYTMDITDTYASAWETNTLGSTKGQHWDGTGTTTYMDKWNGSAATFAATHTVTMPAGDYVFMAAGRGVTTIEASMTVNGTKVVYPTKGDTGKGIDTSGKTNFSDEGTYANDNNGRGWEWRYITLSLTEPTEVEMKLELVLAGNTWGSFSDFKILAKPNKNMAINALITAINNANTLLGECGGDGVFQVASADFEQAIADAEQVADDAASKTMEEIEAATADLEDAIDAFNAAELNAPEEGVTYYVELTDEGFAYANKPLTFKEGNAAAGGYAVGYTENPGSPYNQGVMFEPAEGTNCYYMLIQDAAGNKHYVGTGTNYGGNDSQLRMCDSKEAALVIQVENKNGDIGFINTKTNSYMGSNGDTGFYTNDKYHKFNVWSNEGVSVELTFKAGKYGTAIFPFIPTAEDVDGLKFYACEEVTEKELVLVEVVAPVNDVPYIVENTGGADVTINYTGTAYGYATSLTKGLLTGIYDNPSAAAVPGGAYVLQTQNGIQSFYKVPADGMIGNQYRAYLTYDGGGEINSFGFKTDETTAIRSIDAVLNGEGAEAIYNAAGARIAAPQKGLNIIKMSNGKTVKVLIK